ncbi:hypothetical protein Pint_04065 [Pistacia integerrima]|uniref:Uncharacterized protein n=1 Tax=Pistacia integerrima TaxID=434235 RepID=A0ACC0Z471_9ROSI|nr:hypothetical protein Pint_04065 [Pistacia integerrima]
MANETEPAKLLLPYLQRADELQKHEPLVAYYCRLYAMERGLRIPQNERTKTTNSLLISLMNQLEKDKKSLKLGPEDNLYLEGFALNVFAKADKQDRAGRADLNTAKTFYAASIFFEIINQFGVLQPDLEQKQKYAAWKAADIRKALKEGKKPIPGPPGGGEDLSIPPITPSSSYDFQTREITATGPASDSAPSPQFPDSHYSTNVPPPPQFHDKVNDQQSADIPPSPPSHDFHPPPPLSRSESSTYSNPTAGYPSHDYPPPPPVNRSESSILIRVLLRAVSHQYRLIILLTIKALRLPTLPIQLLPQQATPQLPNTFQGSRNGTISEPAPAATEKYHYDCNYQPTPEKIAEAHKAARFAVGALAFDDVSVAVEHLKKSLELLTNPSAGH